MKVRIPTLKALKAYLYAFIRAREYVYRFEYYDEQSDTSAIDDTNVVQYEFINQGTTIVEINGMKIYPEWAGIAPHRVLLHINYNEMDVTIYKFKFFPIDQAAATTLPDPANPAFVQNFVTPDPNGFIALPQPVNRLLVVVKVKANIATRKTT